MSDVTIDRTLAEVATSEPGAYRVLESFGLDYCCGGSRRLDEACAAAGVDPEVVVGAIEAIDDTPTVDWASMSTRELVDHIEVTHHDYLHRELPRLDDLVGKVVAAHGARHPELREVSATYRELRADLEPHLAKEERVLFPMIRELCEATERPQFHCGLVRNPISMMMIEHERTGEILARLRTLTDDYRAPDDGCASYRALFEGLEDLEVDTHLHIHKENNVLFPAVVAIEERLPAPPPLP